MDNTNGGSNSHCENQMFFVSPENINISEAFLTKWQKTLDVMTAVIDVPAGLIMRVHATEIEVFVASSGESPYKKGAREKLNSGLYCETVIKKRSPLLVPNALKDPEWDHNPDIKLKMISYLGYPLQWPNGSVFGTICVLDRKANPYSEKVEKLLDQFKELINSDLALIQAQAEIKTLSHLLPICVRCKKIRNEFNHWCILEDYISDHTDTQFTHGLCPQCAKTLYPNYCK